MNLSKFAGLVQPSATLAAGAKARQLRASGVEVFDFSLGEPDQPTPENICAAALHAMRSGQTHYTAAGGTPEVRAAITRWYNKYHNWSFSPDRVVVSNGAKHSIHNALASMVGPGDDVIVPAPYWVSYSDLVTMVGAKTVLVPTTPASGFKMSPDQYRAARTPNTKLVMLNSPCNPTGTVYTRQELLNLADAILETDANILSDEIYEQLCYGDARPTCIASLRPEWADRVVTVSGASKSYAMTGWRIGWAVAPPAIAAAIGNIQSQETGCPNSVSQAALVAALDGPQDTVAVMKAEYDARRGIVSGRLKKIAGIKLHPPEGAFYAWFDVSAFFGKALGASKPVTDSASFCNAALEVAHVNLVPGSAFGQEGYVRMSYAAGRDQLNGGLDHLEKWLR